MSSDVRLSDEQIAGARRVLAHYQELRRAERYASLVLSAEELDSAVAAFDELIASRAALERGREAIGRAVLIASTEASLLSALEVTE